MFAWMLFAIVILVIGSYLYKYILWRERVKSLISNVVGLPALPIIGNAHQIYGLDAEQLFDFSNKISDIMDKNGGRFKLWLGPALFMFTSRPEDIKLINNKFLEKPPIYKFADLWVQNGLVNATAEIWKKNVKRVHNAFTPSVVDGFQPVFNKKARKILDKLSLEVGKGPFDAYRKYLGFATFEAICETMLGVTSLDNNLLTKDYYAAFDQITKLLMLRVRNVFHHSEFVYRLSPSFKEFKNCIRTLHGVTKAVIAKKQEEIIARMKLEEQRKANDDDVPKKFRSLLDYFIELKKTDPTLTDQQIQAITDNFIGAGQETTALTTILMLVLLGSHPDIQDKLVKEMKDIFGDSNRDVEKEDLERMHYTEAVIMESLRLYPIVPYMMRQADADLELDDCTIPNGTSVVIFAWAVCRNSRNWGEDSKEFKPERWMNLAQPNPAGFCAFSYGKRSCLGRKFALAFLKTVLAHTIRKLVIKADSSKLKFQLNIAIHPVSGHYIEVEHRKPGHI